MASQYKIFTKGISLVPKAAIGDGPYNGIKGDIELLSSTNKLYFYNGTINDPIVQENVAATLSNKILTAPVINNATADTITGIGAGPLLIQSASNENLSLQAQGTGDVLLESLTINGTSISSNTDIFLNASSLSILPVSSLAKPLRLYANNGTNYIGIQANGVVNNDYNIVLPSNSPNSNTVLLYDGADYVWSPSGVGDKNATNDDVLALAFRARILDTFEDGPNAASSSIDNTANKTTATWSGNNQLYSIEYENTSITTTGTTTPTITISAPLLAVGNVIVLGTEAKRITSISPVTIESAFSIANGTYNCVVSEVVTSKNVYTAALDGASISSAFNSSFTEYLIDYEDSITTIFNPNSLSYTPKVSYSVSQDGTTWSPIATRPAAQTGQIQSQTFAAPGTGLIVRLFANTTGSGTVNLLEYRAYMQKVPTVAPGNTNQAYARLDGSITPQSCSVSVVGGKTRITLSWSYTNGLNGNKTYSNLQVFVNGQLIPRNVSSYLTSGAFYTEVSSSIIDLDTDYSTTPYAIQIIQTS